MQKQKKISSQFIIKLTHLNNNRKKTNIAKALYQLKNITELIFEGDDDGKSILKLLRIHRQLNFLDLKQNTPWSVKQIKKVLKSQKLLNLTRFSVEYANDRELELASDQLKTFSKYFPNLRKIELNIKKTKKIPNFSTLCSLLKHMINPESIRLHMHLTQLDMLTLIKFINNTKLQDLRLSHAHKDFRDKTYSKVENIIDEIGTYIAKMVKLKSLKLHISEDISEIKVLTKYLTKLKNLEYLDINLPSYNYDKHLKFISHDIGKINNLKVLEYLRLCDKDSEVHSYIDQLQNLKHLQKLYFEFTTFNGVVDYDQYNDGYNVFWEKQKKNQILLYRRNHIFKHCVMNFKKIQELNIYVEYSKNNQFQFRLLKYLNEFPKLTSLMCWITNEKNTNLKEYSYFDYIWTGEFIPKQLSIFKFTLYGIFISSKKFQDLCKAMKKMRRLEQLNLSFDKFDLNNESLVQLSYAIKSWCYLKDFKIDWRTNNSLRLISFESFKKMQQQLSSLKYLQKFEVCFNTYSYCHLADNEWAKVLETCLINLIQKLKKYNKSSYLSCYLHDKKDI